MSAQTDNLKISDWTLHRTQNIARLGSQHKASMGKATQNRNKMTKISHCTHLVVSHNISAPGDQPVEKAAAFSIAAKQTAPQ
jgi:hypothetical protein